MFTANFEDHKIKQAEMIRQAEAYRLAKLAVGTSDLISSLINLTGKLIGLSGQQTLTLSEVNR